MRGKYESARHICEGFFSGPLAAIAVIYSTIEVLMNSSGTPTWYTKDPSCQYAVNEYLWLNSLHPTFPMHNATAASVAKFLGAQKCSK